MKTYLSILLLFVIGSCFAQSSVKPDNNESSRSIHIGLSLGQGMNFPSEEKLVDGQKAIPNALLISLPNYFSINIQMGSYFIPHLGYDLELGYQTLHTAFGPFEGNAWNGIRQEIYQMPYVFIKPGLVYPIELGERYAIIPGLHFAFDFNTDSTQDLDLYGILLHTSKYFTTLNPSLEFRINLIGSLYGSFFMEYQQGFHSAIQEQVVNKNGKTVDFATYKGNGFTFGVRASICLPCMD